MTRGGADFMKTGGKSVPGRGNSHCKVPETGTWPVRHKETREAERMGGQEDREPREAASLVGPRML